MISGAQLRAARGLLGWTQLKLAEESEVAISTVKRMEASSGWVRGNAQNVWKIQQALENAGIIFIYENGGGLGVRLAAHI